MAKQRYCRVCGEPFMARRFDALTCTSTCWARKARDHDDLAYLANLPDYLADVLEEGRIITGLMKLNLGQPHVSTKCH